MLRISLLGLFAILLTFCTLALAQSQYYRYPIHYWQGKPVSALVNSWGQPDERIDTGTGPIQYIYMIQTNGTMPQSVAPVVGVNVSPQGKVVIITKRPDEMNTAPQRCVVQFNVNKQHIIISSQILGGYCGPIH